MKTKTKHIFFYILSFLCSMLVIEGFLQLSEIELSYHILDPYIGKKVQSDARIIMLKEGFYLGGSNKYGYIGPAYDKVKKEGEFRIALMGDSFTEGFQLFERHHFRNIMEEHLNNGSSKKVQVLNFGVGGFNFADMYIYYQNYASQFDPDIVIFMVRPNDFLPRSNIIPAPYLYLQNNELKINYDFRNSNKYILYQNYRFFFENSSYVKMLNTIYKLIEQGFAPSIIFDRLYSEIYVPYKYKNITHKGKEERENEMSKTVSRYFDQLLTTKKAIDTLGKNGNAYFLYRADFPENVHNYIVNAGIKVIKLDTPLNTLEHKGIDPLYWKASRTRGHWNHEAHSEIGKYLADVIRPFLTQ